MSANLVEKSPGYFEVEPRPSAEELVAYYRDKYYGSRDGRTQYALGYTAEELEHKTLQPAETELVCGRSGGRLLELGVGEGFTLEHFLKRGWRVTGVDLTADGVSEFFPHLSEHLILGDGEAVLDEMIAKGELFDLIVCNNILEHVIDPNGLLDRLHRVLAPDGLVRISVPNDGSWLHREVVKRGWGDPDFWAVLPDHLNYYDADALPRIMAEHGWSVEDHLAEFPVDLFLLNPESNYLRERSKGRSGHFARVAFEMGLWRERSLQGVVDFRRACARAGIGRNQTVFARRRP